MCGAEGVSGQAPSDEDSDDELPDPDLVPGSWKLGLAAGCTSGSARARGRGPREEEEEGEERGRGRWGRGLRVLRVLRMLRRRRRSQVRKCSCLTRRRSALASLFQILVWMS